MINTSLEYKKALENDKRIFLPKVSIQLSDNDKTVLEIGGANIMQGGLKIDDGTSNQGSFDIGAAIINKLTLNINNIYDDYSLYDFSNAVVTVFVGLQLTNRIEWLKKGVFNADDPRFNTSIITLECLDNMKKFDKQYDGKLGFPATLQTIINYCCSKCGVILNTNQFDNYAYKVYESPFGANEPVTYREIISYCAQIAGCYARCNTDGYLELKWYDTSIISKMGGLDGGNYIDYRSGDSADGGNFIDYTSGNAVDGGNFSGLTEYSHLYSLSSPQIATDDVVITGISVTASDKLSSENTDKNTEGETRLSGSSGYVLKIQNNPLIEYGRASDVANYLGSKINGMKFRPMSVLALGNPAIEAGDCVVITDRKSNSYYSYITNLTYSLGAQESFSCDAETPARNSSQRFTGATKAVVEAKKNTQKQLSQYDLTAQQLGALMSNAMGMYETNVIDKTDGSTVRYLHNKVKMEESNIIWKQTIDAFAVSTDGGKTWKAGHDKDGNILATVLNAIGINAEWIKAGIITGIEIKNESDTFSIDKDGVITSTSENGKVSTNIFRGQISVVNKNSPPIPNPDGGLDVAPAGLSITSTAFNSFVDISDDEFSLGYYEKTDFGGRKTREFYISMRMKEIYIEYPIISISSLRISSIDANLITADALINNSDPRLKNIESHISDAERILNKLETIIFRWKDSEDQKLHMGLNAENVKETFGNKYGIVTEEKGGYKGVSYIEIIPLLVSAVNKHTERLDSIDKKLDQILERR